MASIGLEHVDSAMDSGRIATNDCVADLEDGNAKQANIAEVSDLKMDPAHLSVLMSHAYRWLGFFFVILCAFGFGPAYFAFFKEGQWFMQAVLRGFGAFPFTGFLSMHVISATLWLLLASVQIWGGSTRGEWRRAVHRFLGTWSPLIVVAFVGTALAVTTLQNVGFVPGAIAIMSLISFCWAYYAAKWLRDFPLHKDCIIFSISTSVVPGTSRAVFYAMQAYVPATCDVTTMDLTFQGGTAIAFALELVVLASAWFHLGRLQTTHCMIFVTFMAVMTLYCAIEALRAAPSFSMSSWESLC